MKVATRFDVHTDIHKDKVPFSEPCDLGGGRVWVSQRWEWVTTIVCETQDNLGKLACMCMHSTWTKPTPRQIRKWKKEAKK